MIRLQRRTTLVLVGFVVVVVAATLGYRAHVQSGIRSSPASAARFHEAGSGIVRDTRLGLLWTARDAGRELPWPEAARHCTALAAEAGEAGWRLATIEELASLYDESQEQPCGTAVCRISPAFVLTSRWQWSGTATRDRRAYFDFVLGSRASPRIRPALTRGVLCARVDRAG